MPNYPNVAGPHFSVGYLATRPDEVLAQARHCRMSGFTLTHRGKPLGFLQLASDAPNRATLQPSDAAPRVPTPDPEDEARKAFLARYEPLDDDEDIPAELMQASEPPAT